MIKRLLIATAIITAASSGMTNAQCVPDPTITVPGIYPDSATGLVSGVVGVPYNEVIQAKVLTDTSLNGLPVIISNITLSGVSGLPPGLTYSCTPSSCVFPGGSNGCLLISGTPTTAGTFPIVVELTANGTIFGIPAPPQTTTLDYYFITIDVNSGISVNNSAVNFSIAGNNPNPASGYTDVNFTTPIAGDFTIRLFNMIGKEVLKENIRGMAGMNTTRINLEDVTPGVYMISVENGTSVVTRRMIVSKK
jgi:hypothetical protein